MSADQVSDFVDVLKGLDPSVDPYKYVQEQLQASMVPATSQAFKNLLKANYAFASVGLLAGLIAIIAKSMSRGLWIVRRRPTAHGVLWTPNTTLFLVILSCIFFVFSLLATYYYIDAFVGGRYSSLNMWFHYPLYQPLLWLIHSECWGAAASGIIQSKAAASSRRDSVNRLKRVTGPKSLFTAVSPRFVNWTFSSFYIVHAAIIFTLFCRMALGAESGDAAYHRLYDSLQVSSDNWRPGQTFALSLTFIQKFGEYTSTMTEQFLPRSTIAMRGFGLLLLAQLLIFIPIALRYHSLLGQQLKYLKTTSFDRKRVAPLQRSYLILRGQSVGVLGLSITYITLGLSMGFGGQEQFTLPKHLERNIICGLYFFSLIAVPMNVLLAWRAIRPLLNRKTVDATQTSSMSGIQIHTEVATAVDVDEKATKDSNRYPIEYNALCILHEQTEELNQVPVIKLHQLDRDMPLRMAEEKGEDDKGDC